MTKLNSKNKLLESENKGLKKEAEGVNRMKAEMEDWKKKSGKVTGAHGKALAAGADFA